MDTSLKFFHTDSAFQRRALIKLKIELSAKLDDLNMSDQRKDYILHQLNNVQDIEGWIDLLREINRLQVSKAA